MDGKGGVRCEDGSAPNLDSNHLYTILGHFYNYHYY